MEMIDLLVNHRTIRKYDGRDIEQSTLDTILRAGVMASNTGNMQAYSVIVTRNAGMKQRLAPAHFNQPMVTQAPVVLTFCADFNRVSQWCINRKAQPGFGNFQSFLTASIDAVLVAQNVCVAAESKGMGICYLGTTLYNADKIIEILQLPQGVVPVTTLTLGYPDSIPPLTDRLPMEAVIHHETYNDFSASRIDELYAEKEAMPLYRSFVSDNKKETLAQVFTDVRYPQAQSEKFSDILLATLKSQGFL